MRKNLRKEKITAGLGARLLSEKSFQQLLTYFPRCKNELFMREAYEDQSYILALHFQIDKRLLWSYFMIKAPPHDQNNKMRLKRRENNTR